MAGQPHTKAGNTLVRTRPLLEGSFPFDSVVFHVRISERVVSHSLHRVVDGRGDDHLRDIAILGWMHLHWGGGGRRRPRPRSTRASHQDGGRPRALAQHPHGPRHLIHHSLQRSDDVGGTAGGGCSAMG